MPEGYECDDCGDFHRYTHNATRVEWGEVRIETGKRSSPSKILCPDCGQDVWNDVTGRVPPEDSDGDD